MDDKRWGREGTEELADLLRNREPGLMDLRGGCAVLVPLVEREDGLYLLYEVRARAMRRQPGEVCFPGGRLEGTESPEECALRETEEELGIPRDQVRILGRLDFIAHRAGFLMYPILGQVEPEAVDRIQRNPDEVDEIFLVPLSYLLDHPPMVYSYELLPQPGEDFPYEAVGIPRDYRWVRGRETVPVYPWKEHTIWGLTGRITRHLTELIREMER